MLLAVVFPYLVRVLGAVYFIFNCGFFFNFGQKLSEFRRNTKLFLTDRTGKLLVLGIGMFFKARVAYFFIAG